MRRFLTSLLTLGFAAVLSVAAPVAGAGAATTGTAACPSGYLCVWDQTEYRGNMYKFKDANSWESWAINNHDASWYNHGTSGLCAYVWQYSDYSGTVKVIKPGTSSPSDSAHAHRGSANSWGNC
ncbi:MULTISPECIES: peptidase inhibitor family I36 protein [unclassified Kitasatospora]|uniref:peptidase inhibitor family I36 protein n=1 Tax=unclassified Kitasatospora TaxID=2633591 RepID=UPI001ADF92DB|nr:peptidase inhibitor family I36 protein [Kitasatospora sp. RG8]MBP0448793.1 peptidase inhibitor family I36 protein [Kitasatospora sp. RG8]